VQGNIPGNSGMVNLTRDFDGNGKCDLISVPAVANSLELSQFFCSSAICYTGFGGRPWQYTL